MAGKLTVANIVASASHHAWSQTYHAGGLTAVLSLVAPEDTEEFLLPQAGKKILNNLEAEYFGLAQKDLEGIKHATATATKDIDPSLSVSFIVASLIGNILYVVILGSGKVCLKRGDKIGILLEQLQETPEAISASGYIQHRDIIILQTAQFAAVVSQETLAKSIDNNHPEEIAEILAPLTHRSQEGGASALIFEFQEEIPPTIAKKMQDENQELRGNLPAGKAESQEIEKPIEMEEGKLDSRSESVYKPKRRFSFSLTHSQRLYLSIALLLIIVLVGSIVFFQKRQVQSKNIALFTSIYNPAKEKYDEGQGLLSLNTNLARDDFAKAETLLSSNENAFPQGSTEKKQIDDLLSKVTTAIDALANVNQVRANKVDDSSSPLLAFAKTHPGFVTQDATDFYLADSSGITQVNKTSNKSKLLIPNSGNWQKIGGFGTYLGNFYLLDQKDGILKYIVPSYNKNGYLANGIKPDFSKASSLTIDGSIWVIDSGGSIRKFTKGSQDSLNITGLDKSFSNPTQIVTTVDDTNVYVLDNGNSRIVILKKDGSFVAQYKTGILKSATQMDIDETNKKAFVLSGSSIYEVELK